MLLQFVIAVVTLSSKGISIIKLRLLFLDCGLLYPNNMAERSKAAAGCMHQKFLRVEWSGRSVQHSVVLCGAAGLRISNS